MKTRFTGTYPENWKEISKQVKDASGWKCIRCGHPHDRSTGHVLTVHHLDGNKSHSDPIEFWWNLLALCQKCHLTIQGKLVLQQEWLFEHTEWFRPYYEEYLKWRNNG